MNPIGFLDPDIYYQIIRCTPLTSIDLLIITHNHVLLGRRRNAPARNKWFVPGSRFGKNVPISRAVAFVAANEVGLDLSIRDIAPLPAYEHIYPDNFADGRFGTHYVVLPFVYKTHHLCGEDMESIAVSMLAQHSEYRWFTLEDVLHDQEVHLYTKQYFRHFPYLLTPAKPTRGVTAPNPWCLNMVQYIPNKGRGVVSTIPIPPGEKVLQFSGPLCTRESCPNFSESIQVDTNLWMWRSGGLDDLVNHSCNPNTGLCEGVKPHELYLVSLRPIAAGEEITFDYSTSMLGEPFHIDDCRCGAANCRRRISNFDELPPATQDRYVQLGMLPKHIRDYVSSTSPSSLRTRSTPESSGSPHSSHADPTIIEASSVSRTDVRTIDSVSCATAPLILTIHDP